MQEAQSDDVPALTVDPREPLSLMRKELGTGAERQVGLFTNPLLIAGAVFPVVVWGTDELRRRHRRRRSG